MLMKLGMFNLLAAAANALAPPQGLSRTQATKMGLRKKPVEADVFRLADAAAKRERRAQRNARNFNEDLSTRKALWARGLPG